MNPVPTPITDAACLDSKLAPLSGSDLNLSQNPYHGGYAAYVPASVSRDIEVAWSRSSKTVDELQNRCSELRRILADAVDRRDAEISELRRRIGGLEYSLTCACDTVRESRLFIEGKSPIKKSDAVALLVMAERDYRAALAATPEQALARKEGAQ